MMEGKQGTRQGAKPPEPKILNQENKQSSMTARNTTSEYQEQPSSITGKSRYQVKQKSARSFALQKQASGGGGK
eukprot:10426637-Ditylum_brightwellii.AAC.1